ncbi:hypothetical protein, partial [Salmonella enterica]|uniref:hypothetical protein n=1 Tax=Salmonella enterica TaxID=28901 RepID=UPI001C391DC5
GVVQTKYASVQRFLPSNRTPYSIRIKNNLYECFMWPRGVIKVITHIIEAGNTPGKLWYMKNNLHV